MITPEDCTPDLPTGHSTARGTYSENLEDREIWILAYASDRKYYPQSSDACQALPAMAADGQWETTLFFGGAGERPDIVATVADPDSEASQVFEDWLRTGCATGAFPGFSELPDGLVEMDAITVQAAAPTSEPISLPLCSENVVDDSGIYCTEDGSGDTTILAVEPPRNVARIRIDMATKATDFGDSLWEVEAYSPNTGETNLVTGGEACASSSQNDSNCQECFADKAIDGDMDTRWGSDWYDPQWLQIDLPDPQVVDCIVLNWEDAYAAQYCVTVTEPDTAEPGPTTCPYQANTDEETIVRLIQAESEAVNCEEISIIQAIFADGATVRDIVNEEEWNDPSARYSTLFENVDFRDVTLSDILPAGPGITGDVAYYSSGNEGQYRVDSGEWQSFINKSSLDPSTPYGSDHWTLNRNDAGCWVITEFTFNAGHIPFPP